MSQVSAFFCGGAMRLLMKAVAVALFVTAVPVALAHAQGSRVTPRGAREPFRYAYISKNVSCTVNGRMTRQLYVSQVFGYCEAEVSKGQLIRDTVVEFHQVARASCDGNADVTFEFVNGPHRTEADAEVERANAMRNRDYTKHVEWFASVDYPSTRCR
jgi:hypothetical protein